MLSRTKRNNQSSRTGPWRLSAPPGSCQVTGLTAVALTSSGATLAAAACARPGIAGIFTRTAGTWQTAGPAVPATLAAGPVRVLRLTGTPGGDIALLKAGTGATASLLAARTVDGTSWTVSPPLPVGPEPVRASGTGTGGTTWVLLADGRADIVPRPGTPWRKLPVTPRGTTALAAGPGTSTVQALAVSGAKLTVFELTPAGTWTKAQVISVPIAYGSSS